MLKKSDDVNHVINTRMKVEMSFVGLEKVDKATKSYKLLLIFLTIQEAIRGRQ